MLKPKIKMKTSKIILLIIVVLTTLNSCKVARFAIYNFADINDYKKFPATSILRKILF